MTDSIDQTREKDTLQGMQQSVKTNKMLLAYVICIFTILLQSCNTRKWVQFLEEDNISYDKAELSFEPELISAETVDIAPKLNRLIQSMEENIKQFRNDFQQKTDETILRMHRSTQEELKMPQKPELRHQYGMLFNHQGYAMPGLQSLQLFLAVDLPKIEDLYHEPPEFPNCSNWAAPEPFYNNYYKYTRILLHQMDCVQRNERISVFLK